MKSQSSHLNYTIEFILGSSEASSSTHSFYLLPPIAMRSPYLRSLISRPPPGSTLCKVKLLDVAPAPFNLYTWWLSLGYVPFPPCPSPQNADPDQQNEVPGESLSWRDCADLIDAHILGSQFKDTSFQNYIIDELDKWLEPGQDPSIEVLEYVFGESQCADTLRNFVVDKMFRDDMIVKRILRSFVGRTQKRMAARGAIKDYHRAMRMVNDNDEGSFSERQKRKILPLPSRQLSMPETNDSASPQRSQHKKVQARAIITSPIRLPGILPSTPSQTQISLLPETYPQFISNLNHPLPPPTNLQLSANKNKPLPPIPQPELSTTSLGDVIPACFLTRPRSFTLNSPLNPRPTLVRTLSTGALIKRKPVPFQSLERLRRSFSLVNLPAGIWDTQLHARLQESEEKRAKERRRAGNRGKFVIRRKAAPTRIGVPELAGQSVQREDAAGRIIGRDELMEFVDVNGGIVKNG